jgi:hypothetical protein
VEIVLILIIQANMTVKHIILGVRGHQVDLIAIVKTELIKAHVKQIMAAFGIQETAHVMGFAMEFMMRDLHVLELITGHVLEIFVLEVIILVIVMELMGHNVMGRQAVIISQMTDSLPVMPRLDALGALGLR